MPDIQAHTQIVLASPQVASSTIRSWPGGPGTFSAEADFSGGGSVTLQVMSGNQTWMSVGPDTVFAANGIAGFILPKGARIRALVATATAVLAYATPI